MYYIRKQADLIKINTISDLIRVYASFSWTFLIISQPSTIDDMYTKYKYSII